MEVIGYFIFIHISLLLIGYTTLARLGVFRNQPGIHLIVGYLVSIVLLGLLASSYYIFNIPTPVIRLSFWLIFSVTTIVFVYDKLYLQIAKQWFILTAFILMSAFSICFTTFTLTMGQQFLPDPEPRSDRNYSTLSTKVLNIAQTKANDNYIPYRQAQFFVNRSDPGRDSFINEWGVHFFQRTPLMGSVTAGYFLILNDKPPVDYSWSAAATDPDNTYVKFQILAQILNSLLIIPAFFLIRKIFSNKVAAISVLFLIPSQFFLYNSFFTWPKSFVAFFILLSWLLLLSSRRVRYTALAAIASGLAYLTHDLAVLYIGATVVYLVYSRRYLDGMIIAFGSALLAFPWIFTSSILFHRASSFIYYPISTKDIPQPAHYSEIVKAFFSTSPLKIIGIRLESLFYLLAPYQLLIQEGSQTFFTRLWALGLYSIPGSVGVGLFVPMLFGIYKYKSEVRLWIFVLVPILLSVIVIGWPRGLGALHFAEATVVLLTACAVAFLAQSKKYSRWLYPAFALNIVQLLFFMFYSYNFSIAAISGFKDMIALLFMFSVIGVSAVGIYTIISRKNSILTKYIFNE